MIIKKQQEILYIFEKATGMTAAFSHDELELLQEYAISKKETAFIKRLFHLGILQKDNQEISSAILEALEEDATNTLQALHIELTSYCPLTCPQCYKGASERVDMELLFFERIIAEANKMKIFQIALGGGEPLTYPYLIEAVQLIAKTQMAPTITSSGVGLDKELLNKLKQAGLNHLQISLNAKDEKANSLSRDGYKEAIKALELLSEDKEISFGINWVARQDNLLYLSQLADYARKLGADNINVLRYKPSPLEEYTKAILSLEQTKQLASMLRQIKGVKVKVDSAYSQLLFHLHANNTERLQCGCGAGKTFIAITPDGRFKPCSHLQMIDDCSSIDEYLKNKNLEKFCALNEQLTGLCGECLYKNYCGGCRAICHTLEKDLTAGERDCLAFTAK